MFNPERPVELETDASDFTVAGQIGQQDNQGRLKPIAFFSRKLHGAELNYPIYDKEFLAIVLYFKEYRHYLLGSKHRVTVYTDHKNITHFTIMQELNSQQLHYAETMAEFNYKIIHRKGLENGRANALSRKPEYDMGRVITKGQVFEQTNNGKIQQIRLNAVRKGRQVNTAYTPSIRNDDGPSIRIDKGDDDDDDEYEELDDRIIQWGNKQDLDSYPMPEGCIRIGSVFHYPNTGNKRSIGLSHEGRVWIPPDLRTSTIELYHHGSISGHVGPHKIISDLRRDYDYPELDDDVSRATRQCRKCQQSNAVDAIKLWMKEHRNDELPKDVSWDDGYAVYLPTAPDDNLLGAREMRSKTHNCIWVPLELREQLIKEIHEDPTVGHPGIRRTLE